MPLLPALATRPEREGGGGVNSLFSAAAHDLRQEDALQVLKKYNHVAQPVTLGGEI